MTHQELDHRMQLEKERTLRRARRVLLGLFVACAVLLFLSLR